LQKNEFRGNGESDNEVDGLLQLGKGFHKVYKIRLSPIERPSNLERPSTIQVACSNAGEEKTKEIGGPMEKNLKITK